MPSARARLGDEHFLVHKRIARDPSVQTDSRVLALLVVGLGAAVRGERAAEVMKLMGTLEGAEPADRPVGNLARWMRARRDGATVEEQPPLADDPPGWESTVRTAFNEVAVEVPEHYLPEEQAAAARRDLDETLAQMPRTRVTRLPTRRRQGPEVGRNDPCPCGSGRKYKRCCGSRPTA